MKLKVSIMTSILIMQILAFAATGIAESQSLTESKPSLVAKNKAATPQEAKKSAEYWFNLADAEVSKIDPNNQTLYLSIQAATLADANRFKEAMEVVKRLNGRERDSTLIVIAMAKASRGDVPGALAIGDMVDDLRGKNVARRGICKSLISKKDYVSAWKVAESVKEDIYDLSRMYEALAKAEALEGDFDKAQTAVDRIGDPNLKSDILEFVKIIKFLSINQDLSTTEMNLKDASGILCDYVQFQVQEGNLKKARKVAVYISNPNLRVKAFVCIANAQVENGDKEDAKETCRLIATTPGEAETQLEKLSAWLFLADAQIKAGMIHEARDSIKSVMACVQERSSAEGMMNGILFDSMGKPAIVALLVQIGDLDQAIKIAHNEDGSVNNLVCKEIGKGIASNNRWDLLDDWIKSLSKAQERYQTYMGIASVVESGQESKK